MADWISVDTLFLADAFGNPRPTRVGVVRVNTRIVLGFQSGPKVLHTADLPDYTVDLSGLSDVITTLNEQRQVLIDASGGLS
ncbi:hypothetical protein ALI144C_44765 [Actinosynnema sp. ALI-1.44]|uniref:hypothetical protein n=1 Tax=Actinosynnema sp. ALI-1.44 TaxID=1933779 RepID=UPI00097C72DA|nr:hypothetical protein [Actinosynnema sp. ALI-1.44]ONI73067.1 hypothetical protein ALI144C_44765 [Actinosynnema sp. ALI-1.44]